MPDAVLRRRDLDAVRELCLDNPSRRNALTPGLLRQLDEALAQAALDGVRCVLLRGEGTRAFSSGYDIASLADPSGEPAPEGQAPDARLQEVLQRVEELPVPVVAFLNGPAYGGGLDLAAACDLRLAVSGIRLGMPPARLGIAYAHSGLARFVSLMGQGRARRLFLTAETLTAEEALEAGLVEEVAPPERAEARALSLCRAIADSAPTAVRVMRQTFTAIRRGSPLDGSVEAARVQTFFSEDAQEGMKAFLEKRPPRFTGR